jgi:hypothetical protein
MSDKSDTRKSAEAAAGVDDAVTFEYMGVTWRVEPAAKRPWKYVPTWNAGKWDEAIAMLLPGKQYEKFCDVVVSTEDMNGWFGAYSDAMGGNS